MGGKGQSGPSEEVQQGMLKNQTALTKIAQQEASQAEKLFKETEPGLGTAESFYQDLATGDPHAIMRAIAPAEGQIAQATEGTKRNILATAPSGGEKNLALEMADVNKGAEIGKMSSGAFLNAPNALAALAGQGIGESISAAGTGIGAYSAGSQTLGNLGELQIEGQKIDAEKKGSGLGFLGSLAGDAAELGSAAILA